MDSDYTYMLIADSPISKQNNSLVNQQHMIRSKFQHMISLKFEGGLGNAYVSKGEGVPRCLRLLTRGGRGSKKAKKMLT